MFAYIYIYTQYLSVGMSLAQGVRSQPRTKFEKCQAGLWLNQVLAPCAEIRRAVVVGSPCWNQKWDGCIYHMSYIIYHILSYFT
jgi:hypothetical protein